MLGDDVSAALPDLQRHAESLHQDTFSAWSPNGFSTDGDGYETALWAAQGNVAGKINTRGQQAEGMTRYVTVGGVELPVIEGGLRIGIGATVPEVGWEYQCTAIGPRSDQSLLGRRWRVVGVPTKTHAVQRRLDVVEVKPL